MAKEWPSSWHGSTWNPPFGRRQRRALSMAVHRGSSLTIELYRHQMNYARVLVLSRCPLASVVELDQDTGSGGQESLMISIPWQTTPVSRARSPNCSTSDKLGDERKNIVSSRPHRPSQKKDTVICSERRVQSGPPVAIFFISITLRRLPFASGSAQPCCATGGCSRNKPMSTTCGQPPGEYRHCLETT